MNNYYTYAYLRKDGTPYYIGKGKNYRINSKQRNIKKPRDNSRIIFLKQNLTEEHAFKHEKYMIAIFGRKDLGTGVLHNRTDGGEGNSGRTLNEKTKKKIGEANKISLKGRKIPEEVRQKQSNTWKEKLKNNPRPMSFYEKNLKKMAERNKNDKEKHKRHSEMMKGRTSPNRKPICYNGKIYASMTETMEKTNLSRYLILKNGGKFINKKNIK